MLLQKNIFFLKITLDAIRDTIKIIKYFNLIKLNGYGIIVKLFFIRYFFSFNYLRNLTKISKNIKDIECNFLNKKNFDVTKAVKEVDKFGFSKTFQLNASQVEEIKKYVFDENNINIKKNNTNKNDLLKKNNEDLSSYFKRLQKENISRFTGSINLSKESTLRDVIFSNSIMEFARAYLDCNNFSVNATFFVSNPLQITEKEKYRNAQYFHWDNDFRKFFKLYIYLTEVDLDSGPHVYIPETHKDKLPEYKLCRLYSDKKVYDDYPNPKIFTGKAGSLFLVDSYGLHKGEAPKSKSRLMLNVHYGTGKILYTENDEYIKL
jgi:hypothetical protein